jgi:hypothetical protein
MKHESVVETHYSRHVPLNGYFTDANPSAYCTPRQARRADVGQQPFYLQYCTALVLVVPAAHPFMGALLDQYSTHVHILSYCSH